ncbi:MAG: 5'/3'-nucleotidase SurE [Halarcobacter sp.]
MLRKSVSLVATLLALSTQASALNIVLVNDDSYETKNIQQLKLKLETAGHNVLVSVPCAHQSGTGGNMGSYLQAVPVHKLSADAQGVLTIDDQNGTDGYCVGDSEADKATKTFKDYKNGSPLMASAHGIFKANETWNKNPDLVISGPNEGRNIGFSVFVSGTLGATHEAIVNNIPAIAVSAGSTPKNDAEALSYAKLVADKVVKIVETLETTKKADEAILAPNMGLNVNLPDADVLTSQTAFKFTEVNWESGMALKWSNLGEGYGAAYGYNTSMNLYGLNFFPTSIDNTDTKSEGVVANTYIAISTIDATENAPRAKSTHIAYRLNALVK